MGCAPVAQVEGRIVGEPNERKVMAGKRVASSWLGGVQDRGPLRHVGTVKVRRVVDTADIGHVRWQPYRAPRPR